MRDWEFVLLDTIQQACQSAMMDYIMPFVTMLGDKGVLWIILGLVFLSCKRWRRAGILLFAALLIEAVLCNVILKNLFAAPRPFEVRDAVALLISPPLDPSFPSGHTGAAFAAVSALYFAGMRRWYLALVPAVAIAFSRLYLYVHFPSDILGGIAVGVVSGWLAFRLIMQLEQRHIDRMKKR